MNIIYLLTGLNLGGAEVVSVNLANSFANSGNNVMIIFLTGNNKLESIIDKKIEVIGLDMKKTITSFIHTQKKAHDIIKKFRPDVLHGNMVHANLFARLLKLHCQIPFLISSEHNKNIEGKIRMKLYQITDFLSDINTNVSIEATEYFINQKAFNSSKSITVYNGINLSRFNKNSNARKKIRDLYSIKETEFLYLNVGRLTPAKDQDTLLHAFSILHKKNSNTKLMIVGVGELESTLYKKIGDLGLCNSVILAGMHQNIEEFFNSADCFVLSSEWEGFGLVLAEAMATELPVITTDCGGCAEVVDNAEFIVPTKDIEAINSKMGIIYNMPKEERIKIGRENRVKVSKFDIVKIIKVWEKIYNKNNSRIENS